MAPSSLSAQDERRRLPSVERLLTRPDVAALSDSHGRTLVVEAAREALDAARARIATNGGDTGLDFLANDVAVRVKAASAGTLHPVINATGVIIHTNLGRTPLSHAARAAMDAVVSGYSNLEYDLAEGERGSRYTHAEALLTRLTGAEAALVVNNNAGAVFLTLSALATGRQVVISRGELVEIGGGFRIPDVLRQSGAQLVEVGTTNRTHLNDFSEAIGPDTALLLRVHSSNFKLIGFTSEVPLADLVELGQKRGVLVVDDLGSGTLLDTSRYGMAAEPMVQQSIASGADLVTFSGDKLLGGPQAGLIAGKANLIAALKKHPLTRALRVDKATLAALQATLLHYLRGDAERTVPVWQMISAPVESLAVRAEAIAAQLRAGGLSAAMVESTATVGGGSLPGEGLSSRAVALELSAPDSFAASLRRSATPVIARIAGDKVYLDLRTVQPEQDQLLVDTVLRNSNHD